MARLSHGLIVAVLTTLLWLAVPVAAAPAPQSEPGPTPRARPTATPTRTVEQQIQELELRKLQQELRLLDDQRDRVRQQLELDRQGWRAPAQAVAAFGPTLVGLGFLYLFARVLSYLLPKAAGLRLPAEEPEDEERS